MVKEEYDLLTYEEKDVLTKGKSVVRHTLSKPTMINRVSKITKKLKKLVNSNYYKHKHMKYAEINKIYTVV